MSIQSLCLIGIISLLSLTVHEARASTQNDCFVSSTGTSPDSWSQEAGTLGRALTDGYNEGDFCNKTIKFYSAITDISYDNESSGIWIEKSADDYYIDTPFKLYSDTDVTIHAMGLSECLVTFSETISPITIDLTHITLKIADGVEGVHTLCGSDAALQKVTVCTNTTTCDTAYNMLAEPVSDGCSDADADTYYANDGKCTDPVKSPMATDCDDAAASVHPGATETDNDKDDDCDTIVDDICTDADSDGFYANDGKCTDATLSTLATDCDDTKANVNTAAAETADGVDNNCSGRIDEGTEYADSDGDCFCNSSTKNYDSACETDATTTLPVAASGDGVCDTLTTTDLNGDSATDLDCNTSAANVSPAQAGHDVADSVNNDCDAQTDEDAGTTPGGDTDCATPDADNDGENSEACGGTDCDDTDAAVNTAQVETAGDGVDNNCNGVTDETTSDPGGDDPGDDDCDTDGDGFDASGSGCNGSDCNDNDINIHPGAPEIEDQKDNNCDGSTDEGFTDSDGDSVIDSEDNCPDDGNTDQADTNGDGTGDVCDTDEPECVEPEVLQSDGTCAEPDVSPGTSAKAAPSGCSLTDV